MLGNSWSELQKQARASRYPEFQWKQIHSLQPAHWTFPQKFLTLQQTDWCIKNFHFCFQGCVCLCRLAQKSIINSRLARGFDRVLKKSTIYAWFPECQMGNLVNGDIMSYTLPFIVPPPNTEVYSAPYVHHEINHNTSTLRVQSHVLVLVSQITHQV